MSPTACVPAVRPVPRRPRRALRLAAAIAAAAAALAVSGCTVGGADPEEPTGDAAPPVTTSDEAPAPTEEDTPDGPTPEEISAGLLAAAAQEEEPLGSVSAPVPPQDVATTLDVLEVRRVEDGTFVRLRLTAPDGAYNVGPTTFASGRFGTQYFVRDMYLDDVAGGTRFLPLQFEDSRAACVCPYKPLEVGPEPQVVNALFPALPEGTTTVDLSLAGTDLRLTGLPVG